MQQAHLTRVPIKTTLVQQVQQALHRARTLKVTKRTALINQIRGLLSEYGIVTPTKVTNLRRRVPAILEDASNGVSMDFRQLLSELYADYQQLDERVEAIEKQIRHCIGNDEQGKRLMTIPGIGPLSASALIAAIGDGRQFDNGRQLSAFLGLTPRQHSSGGKQRLGHIHKRGDNYLRSLLVNGARACMGAAAKKTDPHSRWVTSLAARRSKNIATVAQANKNARIAWAVLTRHQGYRSAAR